MPTLRVSCPPALTERAVAVLRDGAGATAIAVHPGASRLPLGDLVVAEVPRTSVDLVVERLRSTDHPGVHVSIEESEPLVSDTRDRPADDEAVVWAQVVKEVHEAGRLSWVNVALVVTAAAIAALGILQDQLLLIVGAMALSPDYFPVAETSLSIARGAWGRAGQGLVTLVVSFGAGAVGAWALTEALGRTGLVTADTAGGQGLTQFIANPDALSVVVALVAGLAGALAITLPGTRGLVGVFVSITTIPAAANIGVAFAAGDWPAVGGAAAQLLVNVASLLVVGTITLALRRRLGSPRPGRAAA